MVTAYAVDADAGSIFEGDVSEGKAVRGLSLPTSIRRYEERPNGVGGSGTHRRRQSRREA